YDAKSHRRGRLPEGAAMIQTETRTSPVATEPLLPATARLGPVRIAVTDRDRALVTWRDHVGLTIVEEDETLIRLGAGGRVLIELAPGAARPVPERHSVLYHVAIHVPTRRDLALVIRRLIEEGVRNAPTDHLVTECTYLW